MKSVVFKVSVAVAVAALAGCANISFKRGASGDAMAADERACRNETSDEAGYVECMRKRGAYVAGRSATSPAATVQATQTPTAVPAAPVAPDADAPNGKATVPPPPALPATVTTPLPPASPTPVDPLEQISVASWWKLGANPADLDKAIDACVIKLGPAYRPGPGATVVTVALRDCLRQDGWFAVGKGSSP
jgi:hypothetical protein